MQRTKRIGLHVALVCCATACFGVEPDSGIEGVPEPPENGRQLVGKPFTVAPGSEVIMCMQIETEITEDIYVRKSEVFQKEGGHHVLVYYTISTAPIDPEPHECDELDMANVRLVATGAARGGSIEIPDQRAFKIPKGARLFFQSHYLNTTDSDIEVVDAVNLTTMDVADVVEAVGSFAHVDLGLDLPPHQETRRKIRCEIPHDMYPTALVPHMHEYGTHFQAHLEHDGQRTSLFDVDWEAAFRDEFPINDDPEGLMFHKGDILETDCTWFNSETEPIRFPKEMCVTFFMFYPSQDGALVTCNQSGVVDEL